MSDGAAPPPDTVSRLLRRRAQTGPLWIDATGSSMGRAIPDGARVRVVAADQPRRGEVWAVCADDGRVVVHRVLGIVGGRWWLRGDTNRSPDLPVAPVRLVGRVVEVDVSGSTRTMGTAQRWAGRARLDARAVRRRLRALAATRGRPRRAG